MAVSFFLRSGKSRAVIRQTFDRPIGRTIAGGDAAPTDVKAVEVVLFSRLEQARISRTDIVPRSMTTHVPQLEFLLRAYFHQDWDIEGPTAQAVLDRFVRESSSDQISGALNDALSLAARDLPEERLRERLHAAGLGYAPDYEGLTHRAWLQLVIERLRAAGEPGGEPRGAD